MKRNEQHKRDTAAVTAVSTVKRELSKSIIRLALMLVVCLAAVAYLSRAWFISVRQVDAQDMVTAVSGVTSLYISVGTEPDGSYQTSAQGGAGLGLYPISTQDCISWYYASGWTGEEASEYTLADITPSQGEDGTVSGQYTGLFGSTLTAYDRTDYCLYTSEGQVDVYLDSDEPITITVPQEGGKQLNEALRVAVVTYDALDAPVVRYVYALRESGQGNSSGTQADTYYAIAAENDGEPAPVAVTYPNTADALCQATEAGVRVSVFVWLEGTDAQAVLGSSDDVTDGLSIGVKFVGKAAQDEGTEEGLADEAV